MYFRAVDSGVCVQVTVVSLITMMPGVLLISFFFSPTRFLHANKLSKVQLTKPFPVKGIICNPSHNENDLFSGRVALAAKSVT